MEKISTRQKTFKELHLTKNRQKVQTFFSARTVTCSKMTNNNIFLISSNQMILGSNLANALIFKLIFMIFQSSG